MKDVLLLIVGAVLGVAATEFWATSRRISDGVRRRRAAENRQEREAQQSQAIVQRFADAGVGLYRTATFSRAITIPFLHDASLPIRGPLPPDADRFLTVTDPKRTDFRVDQKTIRRQLLAGANLWDGNVLYMRRPPDRAQQYPLLEAGVCNYFSYVTEKDRAMRRTGNCLGQCAPESPDTTR